MKSSTNNYVQMKEIYKSKFDSDLSLFKNYFNNTVDIMEKNSKIKEWPVLNE